MLNNRVIYQKPQSKFLEEADLNQVANEMLKEANRIWLHPWESEINSWRNNARSIKWLLELSKVSDTYITFEYLVPYNKKSIDLYKVVW